MKKIVEKFTIIRPAGLLISCLVLASVWVSCADDFNDSGIDSFTGQSGSMARFTIVDNNLYIVDNESLRVVDIRQPDNPVMGSTINLGVGIETVFPYGDEIFIGSMFGMYIFDISNPNQPERLATYQHATACDPVVVQGDLAYVTLRNGTECQVAPNLLQVVDISDRRNPFLVREYSMMNPHGLSIDGNTLFVGEGEKGYQIIDASQSPSLEMLYHFEEPHAYDMITFNNILMIIGDDGLLQYHYTPLDTPQFLSKIPVLKREKEEI